MGTSYDHMTNRDPDRKNALPNWHYFLILFSMHLLQILTAAEQVAHHLKKEIESATWMGTIPGAAALARQLGVGRMTVDVALELLEKEGLLHSQGPCKRRRIVNKPKGTSTSMQVAILFYEPEDAASRYVYELRNLLLASGHQFSIAPKTLTDLKHDPKRVAAMVREHQAEAWVIVAGSEPVLHWFVESGIPAFALFGRMKDLPISGTGPDKQPAIIDAVRILLGHGHSRIVLLVREDRRRPSYGPAETAFLSELQARGIPTGPYNIPDWEESAAGLVRCLDNLFQVTPPTAILVGDPMLFLPVQHYCSLDPGRRSGNVVLVATDFHPGFKWCEPTVPHIDWDHQAAARRVMRWVDRVSRGKDDFRQTLSKANFIEGNLRASST